jgi:hypothetical protein
MCIMSQIGNWKYRNTKGAIMAWLYRAPSTNAATAPQNRLYSAMFTTVGMKHCLRRIGHHFRGKQIWRMIFALSTSYFQLLLCFNFRDGSFCVWDCWTCESTRTLRTCGWACRDISFWSVVRTGVMFLTGIIPSPVSVEHAIAMENKSLTTQG